MFSELPFPLHFSFPAAGKPWIVLIHGLGMSLSSWTEPCKESLLNGLIPFDFVLTDLDHPPDPGAPGALRWRDFCTSRSLCRLPSPPLPFWRILAREGFGLAAWSQQERQGPMAGAVQELKEVIGSLPAPEEVILLGHSRGGLVARKFLQERLPGWERVRGVIFLGTPHHGSRIASWVKGGRRRQFLVALERILQMLPWLPVQEFLSRASAHLEGYLENAAIRELAPLAPLLQKMKEEEGREAQSGIPYFNFIGTCTSYIRFYRARDGGPPRQIPFFSFLDGVETLFPPGLLPPEFQQGRGDGQVSVERAHLPWARANVLLAVNHARLLVEKEVQERVLRALGEI